MTKLISFMSIGLFLTLIACGSQKEANTEKENVQVQKSKAEKIYYYTCPMDEHKNVALNEPGNCPECGMKLVAAVAAEPDSIDYYGCPMPEHSHIRQNKPGVCPECNMKLKPMRLESYN